MSGVTGLSEADKFFAFENLNESKENVQRCVEEIQSCVGEVEDNISESPDINTILFFLRSTKFNVDKAKKKIKSFYQLRRNVPEWFSHRDPHLTEINELLKVGVFLPLKKGDGEKCKIIVVRPGAHSPSKHQQKNVMKIMLMIFDFLYWHDHTMSVYGVKAIFDLKDITLGHCFQMTPQVIKRAVQAMECYPVRVKQLQFVNAPRAVNLVLDIFRSFMSQKLRDRISVTRSNPEFNSADNLPPELGGTGEDYPDLVKYWRRVIEENHSWFERDLS